MTTNLDRYSVELYAMLAELTQLVMIPEEDKLNMLISTCRKILKDEGMAIISPPKGYKDIKKLSDLIEHFYCVLYHKHPELTAYRDTKKDGSIAKHFVKKISDSTGLGYKESLIKCAMIVTTVFNNEEEFKFNNEIFVSFAMFGQDKLGWITEKALQIMNNFNKNEDRLVWLADLQAEEYLRTHEVEFGLPNLQQISEEIDSHR